MKSSLATYPDLDDCDAAATSHVLELTIMGLPMLNRCCGCLSLEHGSIILASVSLAVCIVDIAVGASNLPRNASRAHEDNLISMSMVMFATLSACCNILLLFGIYTRRSGYMQLAMLFNALFVLFNFLVAAVTCLFSPEYKRAAAEKSPTIITFTIIGMILALAFCVYYFLVINSLYRKVKMTYGDTAIPV